MEGEVNLIIVSNLAKSFCSQHLKIQVFLNNVCFSILYPCIRKVFTALHFFPHFVMLQPYSKMDYIFFLPHNDNVKKVF